MNDAAFANTASDSFVLLHLAGCRFAVPANIVAELAPPVRLHMLPHTSPLLTGVIVRRGRIVPVFDAERALSGKRSLAHRFYLIARHEPGEIAELGAIPVDSECELVSGVPRPVAPACASDHSTQPQPAHIAGELIVAGQSIAILDLPALLHAHGATAALSRESHPATAEDPL